MKMIELGVEVLNDKGEPVAYDWFRRFTVRSEADIAAANHRRRIAECGNRATHRVVLRDVEVE